VKEKKEYLRLSLKNMEQFFSVPIRYSRELLNPTAKNFNRSSCARYCFIIENKIFNFRMMDTGLY
jgi:hypothetical protein